MTRDAAHRMTETRKRDRDATAQRIMNSAKALLEEEGPGALGINAVARRAGVDKQLVYRYFGGLDGLTARLGEEAAFWRGAATVDPADSYGAGVAALMRAYLAELRANPSARNTLAHALADSGDAARALSAAREKAVGRWLAGLKGRTGAPPAGVDAPALNALLLAALDHLALNEAASRRYAGLDLGREETWARLDRAIERITTLLDQAENEQ